MRDFKGHPEERLSRGEGPTSLSVGIGVDFAHQEAALVKFPVGLLGDPDQRVPPGAQALHGVGGGVCPHAVAQLRRRLQLLFVTLEDGEKGAETVVTIATNGWQPSRRVMVIS